MNRRYIHRLPAQDEDHEVEMITIEVKVQSREQILREMSGWDPRYEKIEICAECGESIEDNPDYEPGEPSIGLDYMDATSAYLRGEPY